jgi:hypothetical protein
MSADDLAQVGWVIFGLIYLWLRDSGLPLTDETGAYMREHFHALKHITGRDAFSDKAIVEFLYREFGDMHEVGEESCLSSF